MKKTIIALFLITQSFFIYAQQSFKDANYTRNEKENVINKPDLNLDHDYKYYEGKYKRAGNIAGTGRGFIIAGSVIFGLSYIVPSNEANKSSLAFENLLFYGGIVVINIGVPLLIGGSFVKNNNKSAMDKVTRKEELSLRLSRDGLGLVLSF